jgi:hypothetical protein
MDLNVLAIVAAAVVAFVLSGAWYGVLGGQPQLSECGSDPGSEASSRKETDDGDQRATWQADH